VRTKQDCTVFNYLLGEVILPDSSPLVVSVFVKEASVVVARVGGALGDIVGALVGALVGDWVGGSVGNGVGAPVRGPMGDSVEGPVGTVPFLDLFVFFDFLEEELSLLEDLESIIGVMVGSGMTTTAGMGAGVGFGAGALVVDLSLLLLWAGVGFGAGALLADLSLLLLSLLSRRTWYFSALTDANSVVEKRANAVRKTSLMYIIVAFRRFPRLFFVLCCVALRFFVLRCALGVSGLI